MADLKRQDVLVALWMAAHPAEPWTYPQLAARLHLSVGEVHNAVGRLKTSRLYSPVTGSAVRPALLEFLLHGLRYVFPAEALEMVFGVPTAWSARPLSDKVITDESGGAVWPHLGGLVRGRALAPLYRSAPDAALDDPLLHEWLALADAVRAGRARERRLASQELASRLS
jgi:hypothetical protein